MSVTEEDIRLRLRLGEDSAWEFKRFEFKGHLPTSPKRDDLADELAAFANAGGGVMLCGVTDDGQLQGLSPEQLTAVNRLMVDLCTDAVEPPLRVDIRHWEIDGKALLVVEVPRGVAVHERSGRAFIRVGASKRPLRGDERLRLAQARAQSRHRWFDEQTVPNTGFETLGERLWEPLLSVTGAADPNRGLRNLRLLATDDDGRERATVAGVLLCAAAPQDWLPQAAIMATHYRGLDRASGQLDAREIVGPLAVQVADAVQFVVRNMRVAARKTPARVDIPQYRAAAVFEAVVNAVAHRDYSMRARRIRLSMFRDRLEIDSPGQLPNGLTVEGMASTQATRNEVIAAVFGRTPVGDVPGAAHRENLMERRGDGVSIILKETREATGATPDYQVAGGNLVLTIPAAKLDLTPADSTVTAHCANEPLPGVEVLALFPNNTWQRAVTDESGEATFDLYTTNLPMTVYVAAAGYAAGLERGWRPDRGGLVLELARLPDGGAAIFRQDSGQIPGLRGRLNPVLDDSDRTYLYADNIAIEQGRKQPVTFRVGRPLRLTDAHGAELAVTIVDIVGRSALLEYRAFKP